MTEEYTDQLLDYMNYVEEQLLFKGAKLGRDYTILDCAKLAIEQSKIHAIGKLANAIAESIRESGDSIFAGLDGVSN